MGVIMGACCGKYKNKVQTEHTKDNLKLKRSIHINDKRFILNDVFLFNTGPITPNQSGLVIKDQNSND